MKSPSRRLFIAAAAAFILPALGQNPAAGLTPLFDSKTLDGWKNPYEWGEVNIVDGEIQLKGDKKFFLVTEKTFSDFIFEGEVKLPEGTANSGFMFRAKVAKNSVTGYQAEVDGDEKRGWSGGLYDEGGRMWFINPIKGNAESEKAFKERAGNTFKRNDWNHYRISCKGDRLRIEVNGVVVTDVTDSAAASGHIGIQHHGEKGAVYRFRNLKIRELK